MKKNKETPRPEAQGPRVLSASPASGFRTLALLVAHFAFVTYPIIAAEPQTVLEVKQATDNYFRNKNWTPIAAEIKFSFFKNDELKSSCTGPLLFDPLKKKLLLECYGEGDTPVFIFKNDDVHFVLYMPGMKRLWEGNIFELEYAQEFDSHLKPLDLYRAISSEPFSDNQAMSAYGVKDGMEIELGKPYNGSHYLARRLILDNQGQVKNETFFAPGGETLTMVVREKFLGLYNDIDRYTKNFYFPQKTFVIHPASGDTTVMEVKSIKTYRRFPESAWTLWIPKETVIEEVKMKVPEPAVAVKAA